MKRILGFDVARALAILGMMLVNYHIVFSYGIIKYNGINNFLCLFEGRAAAVFLILAGIGISLMTKKSYEIQDNINKYKDRLILIKRAAFLFVLGFILLVVFEWTADILHFYGIYIIIIALFFLFCTPKKLVISISTVLAITFILQLTLDYTANWTGDFTYYNNLYTLKGLCLNTFFNGYHPVFPWIVFILLGLILGKLDFKDPIILNRMIVDAFALAIIVEVVSIIFIEASGHCEITVYIFNTKPMNPTIFYVFASSGWATAFIGICVKLCMESKNSKIVKYLATTGQMALTHYVIHCVIVLTIFTLIDNLSYKDELFVVILSTLVFLFMIAFSNIWIKYFKRGPLELIMRRITK
ncbi:DUF418 domain-containing protein [Clostridiaceae bacterium M8S5]|nr:DUF418 domain-containing protein [Clostridiaceae bacterium M8S5]